MTISCDQCEQVIEMTEEMKEMFWASVINFWDWHGHFAGRAELKCDCGSSIVIGPYVNRSPLEAWDLVEQWFPEHREHLTNAQKN